MNEVIKVSVVLPVYNVEAYLKHSLSCLVNQTMREIEIICVDDGSTDASVRVIQNFMERDPRIKLFLNEHSYAGAARNTGLEHAQGKWVMLLDPDDYYDLTMLEELYCRAEVSQVDMFLCGVYNVFSQHISYTGFSQKPGINSFYNEKIFNALDLGDDVWSLIVYPYNKIYRRDFLNDNQIRFQTIQNTNDASFAFEAVVAARRMSAINKAYYYYRHSRPGNTRTTKGSNLECVIKAYEYSYDKCKQYPFFRQCEAGFKAVTISNYVWHFQTYASDGENEKRFFFDYIKNYVMQNFEKEPRVRAYLRYYGYGHYYLAHFIKKNSYEKTCNLLKMRGWFRIRVMPWKVRHYFLGIPIWQHSYSEEEEIFRFCGLPLAGSRYKKGFKKSYILGIQVSRSEYLLRSVLRYLRFISNRINAVPSSTVICVFNIRKVKRHPRAQISDIFQRDNVSAAHFVVSNNKQTDVLKKLLEDHEILSISTVEVDDGLNKASYYSLRHGYIYRDLHFQSISI